MGERKGMKGLELWCRKKTEGYPGVKIDNMTTSWRDGLAFCAIIHHFRPDLIDFVKLNKDDIYHNNELAFRVAEHHLGIPALLEAEDMVEYEVPDRLSILTYMSQFYQTFEVQRGKSGARVAPKRPQSTPDHGIVSPSSSPPSKVQITIGKARREPCAKCGLPVFIAERLNVGKLLYHRTCFRCARCQSQLTLANYYETENGEFCCEICPDEEKLISKKISSEQSVLMRSMSDEEKSASLLSFSEAPDAYSTHFETALEFPIDGELQKNFTLSQKESSEFSKARSTFFQSQIEDSSDSGSENIPPDLPVSKPPILDSNSSEKNASSLISDSSGFSSYKPDSNLVSDNISEQTNDRFVTKDNVSSSPVSISVRARMKLFENNEDKKSDVHKYSPSKRVPSPNKDKKKATVVSIDDLEDFDKVSNKDYEIPEVPVDKNFNTNAQIHVGIIKDDIVELEEKIDKPKDSKTELTQDVLKQSNILTSNDNVYTRSVFKTVPQVEKDAPVNIKDTSVITVDDSIITIDSDSQKSYAALDNSVISIEDSSQSEQDVKENTECSFEDASKNYRTAFEMDILSKSDKEESPDHHLTNEEGSLKRQISLEEKSSKPQITLTREENLLPSIENVGSVKISVQSEVIPENSEPLEVESQSSQIDEPRPSSLKLTDNVTPSVPSTEINLPTDIETVSGRDETEPEVICPSPSEKNESPKNQNEFKTPQEEEGYYPTVLNPFGNDEDDKTETTANSVSLNPFGEPDEEEEEISPKPVPAPRPKKKIIPSREEWQLSGTPETMARIMHSEWNSINPFEDDEDEETEIVPLKPLPSPRQKKKVIVPIRISLNPFSSDEEEEEKIVPVPKPRESKSSCTNLPEPTVRSTLSVGSRGSHGGSNSSISSGSAVGSTRKKKPAPRPPLPFRNDHSGPSSLTSSPSQSVAQSPNSSSTLRSRKTKRAPLPPGASTPAHAITEPSDNLLTQISPIYNDNLNADGTPKEKDIKNEENRNRQSINLSNDVHNTSDNDSNMSVPNKSTLGRWKRKKGQAPSRPIPERRIVKTLPMSEIRRELETIEIQQQGLEKQGVKLEQIIREKCEGSEATATDDVPIEVEDLILQLFELVNEKNELFRRQAELMYIRRQQRLEEEYADVEYQIRCLMMQPEANKPDSDKAKEEMLINRLVEIVERRNEIIECLEMDRVREAEEDNSISSQLNLYSMKRDGDKDEPEKDEKKEKKKKLKKIKKMIPTLHKHKEKEKEYKVDIDKDVDETESNTSEKKKKKKFLF